MRCDFLRRGGNVAVDFGAGADFGRHRFMPHHVSLLILAPPVLVLLTGRRFAKIGCRAGLADHLFASRFAMVSDFDGDCQQLDGVRICAFLGCQPGDILRFDAET
jgi:hypothetical protein